MNFVLDELWNQVLIGLSGLVACLCVNSSVASSLQGVYQHQLLFLVDPEIWEALLDRKRTHMHN